MVMKFSKYLGTGQRMELSMGLFKKIWHAFFYILMPPKLKRYALTCKETVMRINTQSKIDGQVSLHMSLCDACKKYFLYSEWLRKNIKVTTPPVTDLNEKLFERIKKSDNESEGENK